LRNLGIEREDCYVTNIVKCRPQKKSNVRVGEWEDGNANPDAKTKNCCWEQWSEEWSEIKNKVVLVLGDTAGKKYLGRAISNSRGFVFSHEGNQCLLTFHPGFLIRPSGAQQQIKYQRDLGTLSRLLRGETLTKPEVNFSVVKNVLDAGNAIEKIWDAGKYFAFDIETNMLNPFGSDAEILSLAISNGSETFVFDMRQLGDQIDYKLKQLFESEIPKIAQNAKFEIQWLKVNKGINVKALKFDTMVAQALLDEGLGTSVALSQMVWKYFPEFGGYDSDIDHDRMSELPKKELFEYNATDAYLTYKIAKKQNREIRDKDLVFLYHEVLIPAMRALAQMEMDGIQLSRAAIEREIREGEKELKKLERKINNLRSVREFKETYGEEEFKINSVHHLRKVFFEILKVRVIKRTPKKAPSVDAEVLEHFSARGSKLAKYILEYRGVQKTKRTYYDSYLELIDRNDRLHPSFYMTIIPTGRLAARNPNVHNVPEIVRKVYVSRFDNGKILNMDFRQIEFRIIAVYSDDDGLKEIFSQGRDIHSEVAARILKKPLERVSVIERKRAKSVGFMMLYGGEAEQLAKKENIPVVEAEDFVKGFFHEFRKVKNWQLSQKMKSERNPRVKTKFNRVWNLSAYAGNERHKRSFNFPIQSTASDINLYFLGLFHEFLEEQRQSYNLKSKIVNTVHDSIVVDCPADEVEVISKMLGVICEQVNDSFYWLTVPMQIDIEIGDTWSHV